MLIFLWIYIIEHIFLAEICSTLINGVEPSISWHLIFLRTKTDLKSDSATELST
jgi:hypothetical protein